MRRTIDKRSRGSADHTRSLAVDGNAIPMQNQEIMFNITKKELDWGGRALVLETGRLARQADGAVIATYGDTTVLAAAVASRTARPDVDFFPLTVHYLEKYFAAGKIPGGFFKREARPTEKETLTSRLIDRPIRPLFPRGFRNETQIVATVLSHDLENDPDIVAMIAVSASLAISGIPFRGPIGGARVGFRNGTYTLNPAMSDVAESRLDLVVAGTADAVMMVESEAQELTEEEMLGAVTFGHAEMQPVIRLIEKLAQEAGKKPWDHAEPDRSELEERIRSIAGADLETAFGIAEKSSRREQISAAQEAARTELATGGGELPHDFDDAMKSVEKSIVRSRILDTGSRIDGRDSTTVRPIACQVGELPRTHGSAIFTRGETQVLSVTTLGTGEDEQIMDSLHANYRERFMLHYNFPPYSVGEARRMGPPGRREIGHGKLAWRALQPVLPAAEEFPYTVRVVSEVLESNGSSSMATVCGSSLSMMDAGVPLRRAVAGIAMGLILEGDRHAVLTDILGDEDHLGDMDFKVAGTERGVTALQMDIKVTGVTAEIMRDALAQAKEARLHILGEMGKALSDVRQEFSAYAPRIAMITIPVEKIRDVIGTGGKIIRSIVEETGAKVDVNDDGTVKIASSDADRIEAAKSRILELTSDPEPGRVYDGTVVKIMEFGAFVNFFGKKDGLVHVSQIANRRIENPADVLDEGQTVKVLHMGSDDRGRVKLSMKAVDQETGEVSRGGGDFGAARRPERRSGGRDSEFQRGGGRDSESQRGGRDNDFRRGGRDSEFQGGDGFDRRGGGRSRAETGDGNFAGGDSGRGGPRKPGRGPGDRDYDRGPRREGAPKSRGRRRERTQYFEEDD